MPVTALQIALVYAWGARAKGNHSINMTKTGNVRINVKLRRVRVTIIAVEKQKVLL
jgi:hypothetical protein